VLRELIAELATKDSGFVQGLRFIPEMALIATEVRAYPLADSILRRLSRRSRISNDPLTYNYLDHYYLAQSRLDVYWRRKQRTPYLDSLGMAFDALSSPLERLYYALQLANLNAATGNYAAAYRYRTVQAALQDELGADKDFEKMQRAMVESETAAERRKLELEATISRSRIYAVWILSLLLAVITVLSLHLHRRNKKYRAQSMRLLDSNTRLDAQIEKVEVLNKEIQHRIKNNLYTIYSLLHMQQDSTDNEEVIAHLEAARLRVESVATLHDHLLTESETVDFGAYLKVLVGKVVDCFAERRRVVTHLTTEPVSLPLNTCFALSLILNEWITNSIKYAVSPGEVLNMDVRISNEAGQVCIRYADDGAVPGQQAGKSGLGSEIVRLLTAQVRGQLRTIGGHPYHYNLCIPNGQPH
jgi:two-component sensor histidine kinase